MAIEFTPAEVEKAMANDPEVREGLEAFVKEVTEYAKSIAPVFGETGRAEHRKAPPEGEPGAYRDSIVGEVLNANRGRVSTDDYKAFWIEFGAKHMPEYAVFAKTAAHFGGTGPDGVDGGVQSSQEHYRREREKLREMTEHAGSYTSAAFEVQKKSVERATAERSAAFKAARSRGRVGGRRGRSR